MIYRDRRDAGRKLGSKLVKFKGVDGVVLGLPRGGVPVAAEVARALGLPLSVLVVRKIGMPRNPELGVGAISEAGVFLLDKEMLILTGTRKIDLKETAEGELQELKRRTELYRGGKALPDLKGKTAILVDDGLATGVSARAAVQAVRKAVPKRTVMAVPVCAAETARKMRMEVDEMICLHSPENIQAIGHYYQDFSPTSDAEVVSILNNY